VKVRAHDSRSGEAEVKSVVLVVRVRLRVNPGARRRTRLRQSEEEEEERAMEDVNVKWRLLERRTSGGGVKSSSGDCGGRHGRGPRCEDIAAGDMVGMDERAGWEYVRHKRE
jgi:hypothetical protein